MIFLNSLNSDLILKIVEILNVFGCGKYIMRYVELMLIGDGFVVDMFGFSLIEWDDL